MFVEKSTSKHCPEAYDYLKDAVKKADGWWLQDFKFTARINLRSEFIEGAVYCVERGDCVRFAIDYHMFENALLNILTAKMDQCALEILHNERGNRKENDDVA